MAMLAAHLLFNLWVVFGVAVTRGRPKLAGLHIASLLYGTVMGGASWSCPLTLAENWFKARAGLEPYEGPCILHYLQAVVSPGFPMWLLRWGAIGVGLVNLAVYTRRFARARHRAL
jgi:hypothetical protein